MRFFEYVMERILDRFFAFTAGGGGGGGGGIGDIRRSHNNIL